MRGLARDEGVEVVPAAVNEGRLAYGLEDDAFVAELLDVFLDVPVEWRAEAIGQVKWVRKMATLPPVRVVGDDEEREEDTRR